MHRVGVKLDLKEDILMNLQFIQLMGIQFTLVVMMVEVFKKAKMERQLEQMEEFKTIKHCNFDTIL